MRIVCFHLNQVGDLMFALPVLKCLRESFADAEITSVVRPSVKEVLEGTGLADEVVVRRGGMNLGKLRLARELASRKFDLAVVLSQSAECALLAYLGGARQRIGFINTSLGSLLTERVGFKHPPSTENNLRLLSALGCRIDKADYVGLLSVSSAQVARASGILASCGIAADEPLVAFSPGTSGRRRLKEWTDSGFAEVGRHLSAMGVRVVVLGTVPAAGITDACRDIIDLSGKTNLGEVAAILARCRTLVAVDSGVLHLCAAAGTPVVGLYGPTDSVTTGPQGQGHIVITSGADCAPCGQGECRNERKCMTDLDSAMVIEAVEAVMARRG